MGSPEDTLIFPGRVLLMGDYVHVSRHRGISKATKVQPSYCGTAHPVHATPARPATASTPESRSAAALALSHEPTFDEGTA
jgi:hypothetical protein